MIHKKYQDLIFFWKKKKKKSSSTLVVIGALRVNPQLQNMTFWKFFFYINYHWKQEVTFYVISLQVKALFSLKNNDERGQWAKIHSPE